MITSTFTSELGEFTLTIDDSGTSSTGFATKIGTIKYDFDIVGDENTVTSKIVAYNTFNFEMRDLDAVGDSLYGRLYTALASAAATVKLEVSVYANDESWQFAFILNQSGLELDENTGILKCACTTFLNTSVTIGDAFTTLPTFEYLDGTGLHNAISVGAFIGYVLSVLNPLLPNEFNFAETGSTAYSNFFYEDFDDPELDLGLDEIALCLNFDNGDLTEGAIQILGFLSILEGGIFGTGFDKNFYINRVTQGTPIEIQENYVLKRSFKPRNPAFSEIQVAQTFGGNLVATTLTYSPDVVSSRTLNIDASVPYLCKGKRMASPLKRLDGEYTGHLSADIEPLLLDYGLESIKQSYPVGITKIVNAEIRDCAKLKVYDSFYFADKPSEVFRISYAEYDFMSNSVNIIAYQI